MRPQQWKTSSGFTTVQEKSVFFFSSPFCETPLCENHQSRRSTVSETSPSRASIHATLPADIFLAQTLTWICMIWCLVLELHDWLIFFFFYEIYCMILQSRKTSLQMLIIKCHASLALFHTSWVSPRRHLDCFFFHLSSWQDLTSHVGSMLPFHLSCLRFSLVPHVLLSFVFLLHLTDGT